MYHIKGAYILHVSFLEDSFPHLIETPLYFCQFVNSSIHESYLEFMLSVWFPSSWPLTGLTHYHLSVDSPHPHWLIRESFLEFSSKFLAS